MVNHKIRWAPEIIWDGAKRTFSKEQIATAEELNDDYHEIIRLFFPDIYNYFGKQEYVVHHIDGDHSNNHPGNLQLMNRSDHTRMHWEIMPEDEYDRLCEVHRANAKNYWANLSPDEYANVCKAFKEGKAAARKKALADVISLRTENAFLLTYGDEFTRGEFGKLTNSSNPEAELDKLLQYRLIVEIGMWKKIPFYKSQIYIPGDKHDIT